jgi:hypothetical protein
MFFATDKFKIEKWEREKKPDRLIKAFKKNNNEDIRILVIQSLGRIGGDTVVKFLIESLKDVSSEICKEIIEELIFINIFIYFFQFSIIFS